jgi:hypothetical protein
MRLIAMRLPVLAVEDPNFPQDGQFDSELLEYAQTLTMHMLQMSDGVRCGVPAACMLRAWHRPDLPFDEHHNVARLFGACDLDRLGDAARRPLRTPLQAIHELWLNGYRYAHDEQVRTHLHQLGLDRDVHRKADRLKVKCAELYDACSEVVTVGEGRWTRL